MERIAWALVFGIVWLLMVPGIILTHLAVGNLINPITELPANIVKGFDEVFKFAYLEADSMHIKSQSALAVSMCDADAPTVCQPDGSIPQSALMNQKAVNISSKKQDILATFGKSLGTVQKVANDKYFGVPDFNSTAMELNKITAEINKIPDQTQCGVAVVTFCATYLASDEIVKGMSDVTKQIDKFKDSKEIDEWVKLTDYMTYLHILPYFLVVALLFFTCFWWFRGACCCCKGGSCKLTLALFPFGIFWLVSFVIWIIIIGAGIAFNIAIDEVKVPELREPKPTIRQAIEHIKTTYPEFWNLVFEDMSKALSQLYLASWFMNMVQCIALLYSCCVCLCRPYVLLKQEDAGAMPPAAATPEPAAPTPEPAAPQASEQPSNEPIAAPTQQVSSEEV